MWQRKDDTPVDGNSLIAPEYGSQGDFSSMSYADTSAGEDIAISQLTEGFGDKERVQRSHSKITSIPVITIATIYNGEDNLQVFPAQLWHEHYLPGIPDPDTIQLLRSLDMNQILALTQAFDSAMSNPDDHEEGLRKFFQKHSCASEFEISAVNALLSGENWQQYIHITSYIAANTNDWILRQSLN
uniref:Uncharacterized protein n=1 Tax=Spongospora subterranea TaxID=70186 RepID=A0A0H5QHV0_9EUKA|eukprot:CRZ01620.1 hypothetical protein [Spongospora subterranea]